MIRYTHSFYNSNTGLCEKQVVEIGVGTTISVETVERRLMSDVWGLGRLATYWDDAEGKLVQICRIVDDLCRDDQLVMTVDATDEVKAKVAKWQAAREAVYRANEAREREEARLRELARPAKGKWVEVIKGRKVPFGTKGYVFWEGRDSYGTPKLGVATSDRRNARGGYENVVWVPASYTVVIDPPSANPVAIGA